MFIHRTLRPLAEWLVATISLAICFLRFKDFAGQSDRNQFVVLSGDKAFPVMTERVAVALRVLRGVAECQPIRVLRRGSHDSRMVPRLR